MATEFFDRDKTATCEPCERPAIPAGNAGTLDPSSDTREVHINAPRDPLPYNADYAAAEYVINQVSEDLAVALTNGEQRIPPMMTAGGMALGNGASESDASSAGSVPSAAAIAAMIDAALSDAGATSSVPSGEVANNILSSLLEVGLGAIAALSGLGNIASWLSGLVNGGFGGGGAFGAISAGDGGGGGGGAGEGGAGANGEGAETPKDKALEFWNDLEFLYQEFEIKQSSPGAAITDVEFPFMFDLSLITSDTYELLSKVLSTYRGYIEEVPAIHWPVGFPQISPPGLYSFEDQIETQLTKVKRRSLKSKFEAQMLLLLIPSLFTFDPNRTREANRRCRTLKSKLFKVISLFPTMWDLWDGVAEWTTQYIMAGEIDKSQLFFESQGGYLRHSFFAPRLVRSSVARKNFSEDRLLCQGVYNQTNDFMQYCMSDAYLYEEVVENSSYATIAYEWDDELHTMWPIATYHPGVPTTTYKTQNLMWVGEKLKGDAFFHTVILPMADPFPLSQILVGMAVPLIEYLFHKAEITTVETYDWNTRTDFRRLALVDYRGYKRMNKFKTLDRSGLDVIFDE